LSKNSSCSISCFYRTRCARRTRFRCRSNSSWRLIKSSSTNYCSYSCWSCCSTWRERTWLCESTWCI